MAKRLRILGAAVVALAALAWYSGQPSHHDGHHDGHGASGGGFFATLLAHTGHLFNASSGLPHGVPDFCNGSLMSSPTIVNYGNTLNITTNQSYTCLGIHGVVNVADNVEITADVIMI